MKKESKNWDFVQLYRSKIDELPKMAKENIIAFTIFMFIVKNMDTENSLVVSTSTMAELTGVTRQTIWRANKYLQDNGYMTILRSGNSTVYTANQDIVWTTYNNKKKYATLSAKVMLSQSEAEKQETKKDVDASFVSGITDFTNIPAPV